MEKFPWEEDYGMESTAPAPPALTPNQPQPTQELNPWDDGYDTPQTQPSEISPGEYMNRVTEDPTGLQKDIDTRNDERTSPELPEQGVIRSKSEVYAPVDTQDKYKPLSDYEGSFSYANGINFEMSDALDEKKKATYSLGQGLNPLGGHFLDFRMPPELEALKAQREEERTNQYNNTGQADSVDVLAGNIPVRTQQKRENNPAFDPSKPEGPDNPAMISTRYLVDPPTMDTIKRMGYQVLQNIVGGVGDAVTEGKLTGEGRIGRNFPETVPNQTGEKFVDDLSTFFIGAKGADKVIGAAGKGLGLAGGVVGKAAETLSPEAAQAIRTAYDTTLKGTGSAIKAKAAANAVTRNMLVGMSLGLKTAQMGVADAVVAPNDSQGLISPQWIQKEFGVSRERADDYSVMLDSPVIAGSLKGFGKLYNVLKDKVVSPTVGGLRNLNVVGVDVGKVIPLGDRTAGLKLLTSIDPNITRLAPEDAAFKIKVLSDTVQRNGVKNLQLAGAGKQIKLDTPTAFAEVADDYYRTAYSDLKESMGDKEFNEWVSDQAHNSSRTLFEIRTAISSNEPNAVASTRIKDLFDEGANSVAGGNLVEAQGRVGQMAEQRQLDRTVGADLMEDTAKQQADEALEASRRGVSDDPEFKLFMDEANAELGSKKSVYDTVPKMSEKTYTALKKLKTDTDNAYKAVADTGADGDPVSILEIIKKHSDVTPGEKSSLDPEELRMREKLGLPAEEVSPDKVNITDPFLRKVANEVNTDPSIGNIYNNVRQQVSKEIQRALQVKDTTRLDALYELRDNISGHQLDHVASEGDDNIKKLVANAKGAYNKYRTTFGEPEAATLKKAGETRLKGEKFDPGEGPGQGKTNWDVTFGDHIQKLDGLNGKPLREALKRAAKAGGQDIDGDLANYYATRAITNLTNSVSAGGKESVTALRGNISGIIEGLQGVNSPMVPKLRALETKLQTLENTALDKGKVYEDVKKQADELRKEASRSILGRFVYKDGHAINPSEIGGELKKIFKGARSVSDVNAIIKEAEKAGVGPQTREALQGTYLDYLGDRVQSRSSLGIGEAGPKGQVRTGYRISETQADKIFDEGGNDMANMKAIFSDKPEIVKTLNEIRDVYTNLSKKTPKMDGDVLGPLSRSEDPEQALQSVVTLVFGPLNRTGSKVRRITTPMGVESLAQVRSKRADLLNAMMEDTDKFETIAKKISSGIMDDEVSKYMTKTFGRAFSRANSNFLSQETYGSARETPALTKEMLKMK